MAGIDDAAAADVRANADVVGCDVVELCPVPGLASPNFIAAKLVYKLLTYKFGLGRASR